MSNLLTIIHPEFILPLGRFIYFAVSKKHSVVNSKIQSYKFKSCYGLNMQRMQILHGLLKEEYINIFEPKICDQIVDESLISLFFEK